MAFDPRQEDYQRLGLRFARTIDSSNPLAAARQFVTFGHRFAQDRDSLPQTDEDRAFHLVVEATSVIDYQLPFAAEEDSAALVERGHQLLDEAVKLDPCCYDAVRMRAASLCASYEDFYRYLEDNAEEVRSHCEELAAQVDGTEVSEEQAALERRLAMTPYFRWLADQAEKSLICGRYHRCIDHAREALRLDPHDEADVRYTAAYAFAKLEDEDGLGAFEAEQGKRFRTDDAWTLLARCSMAHARGDYDGARQWLDQVVRSYPMAQATLTRQDELPDGVFSRLLVEPRSEDELILAVSEGTVLMQEGRDEAERGVLGSWVINELSSRMDGRKHVRAQAGDHLRGGQR